MIPAERSVLFFDGICNLCNQAVVFILKHDREQQFLFASLQSEAGAEARQAVTQPGEKEPDSLILYHQGRYYTKSSAALKTLRLLGFPWKLAGAFFIIPRGIRDSIYDLVARKRYKWFGKREACMIPTPELQARFLS